MLELLYKYHQDNLTDIRRKVGASFVAYEQYRNTYHLRVIKNKIPYYFKLEGTPNDVTPQKYQQLLKVIQSEI